MIIYGKYETDTEFSKHDIGSDLGKHDIFCFESVQSYSSIFKIRICNKYAFSISIFVHRLSKFYSLTGTNKIFTVELEIIMNRPTIIVTQLAYFIN